MAILETNDDGWLHVPPEFIANVGSHAKFEVEVLGNTLILRPTDKGSPYWQKATSRQRAEAFRNWVNLPRPSAPDLTDEESRS